MHIPIKMTEHPGRGNLKRKYLYTKKKGMKPSSAMYNVTIKVRVDHLGVDGYMNKMLYNA